MTNTSDITVIDTAPFLAAADVRAKLIGTLEKSIRGLQASQVGALGELVGMYYLEQLGIEFRDISATTHDAIVIMNNTEKKIEFKTKERTVVPNESFDCTVPMYNKQHQMPDYYIFISLLSTGKSDNIKRFQNAYILGSISRHELNRIGKLWQPSDVDQTNNWKPTIDCLNVKIKDLNKPKALNNSDVLLIGSMG